MLEQMDAIAQKHTATSQFLDVDAPALIKNQIKTTENERKIVSIDSRRPMLTS
jgi:hypothetical protein